MINNTTETDIIFNKIKLHELAKEKLTEKDSVGLDKVTSKKFLEKKYLTSEIDLAINKISSESYSFTKYRQVLASKGKGKEPRAFLYQHREID